MKLNIAFKLLSVMILLDACHDKEQRLQLADILCGDDYRYWTYTSGVPGDLSWMGPSFYYFSNSGIFLKICRLWNKKSKYELYLPQWKLCDNEEIIIAGYKYKIVKYSKKEILLYNNYTGGYIDTLKYVDKKNVPVIFQRNDIDECVSTVMYSEE